MSGEQARIVLPGEPGYDDAPALLTWQTVARARRGRRSVEA